MKQARQGLISLLPNAVTFYQPCYVCAMSTILRIGGLRFTIYPNDHPPPHVHVIGAKGEAVLLLNCPDGPAELRESFGFNGSEIRREVADLFVDIPRLCDEWRTMRGTL